MKRLAIVLSLLALSGCALCPSMDDNCWLIRHLDNGRASETRFIVPLYTWHLDETKRNGFVTPPDDCPYSMAVSDFENEYFPNYICRDI